MVILALIFTAIAIVASAQGVRPLGRGDDSPQSATPAILAAFDRYQIVAMHAAHGLKDNDDFILSLIRDPGFPDKVNDVVVECGNSLYQDLLDRYISGERVALSEAQQIWRNTTGPMCGLSGFYDQLFPLVRELNQSLPAHKRLRVVAADPAFDWSQVKTGADIPNNRVRAVSILATMEREVLSKKRHALMLFGIAHLFHGTRSEVSMYERTYSGITFVIAPHMGLDDESQNAPVEKRMQSWSKPSLVLTKGTWLGDLPIEHVYFPPPFPPSVEPVKRPLSDFIDAYLYLGPLDSLSRTKTPARVLDDSAYMVELARRASLGRSLYSRFNEAALRKDGLNSAKS